MPVELVAAASNAAAEIAFIVIGLFPVRHELNARACLSPSRHLPWAEVELAQILAMLIEDLNPHRSMVRGRPKMSRDSMVSALTDPPAAWTLLA